MWADKCQEMKARSVTQREDRQDLRRCRMIEEQNVKKYPRQSVNSCKVISMLTNDAAQDFE